MAMFNSYDRMISSWSVDVEAMETLHLQRQLRPNELLTKVEERSEIWPAKVET